MPRGGVKGNRGGGRKSAFQEQADAAMLWDIFKNPTKLNDLKKRIDAGTFSVKDMMIYKALTGSERIISDVFKKLFPDLEKVDHSGAINIQVVDFEGDGKK